MRKLAPKWAAAAVCAYEVAAIATGRTPTVTALCGRYRWLGPTVLTALAIHLYLPPPSVIVVPVAADWPAVPRAVLSRTAA